MFYTGRASYVLFKRGINHDHFSPLWHSYLAA